MSDHLTLSSCRTLHGSDDVATQHRLISHSGATN